MSRDTALIKLGAPVRFKDRWQGRVSGYDVSADWELLNIVVTSGLAFTRQSVRLPFSAVTDWGPDGVDIDAVSFHAFAREVAPVAVPSSPISSDTPVSHPGARLSALLVRRRNRTVSEVLIASGRHRYRIGSGDVRVEGNAITLGKHFDTLPRYYSDEDLEAKLHDLVAEDPKLTPDDKRSLTLRVEEGIAIIGGNVRVEPTRNYVRSLAQTVTGVLSVREEVTDDISLEMAIGLALDRAGLQRRAKVFARSSLGRVTVYGSAGSDQLADDVTREIARVPGVREVDNRLGLNGA